MTLPPSPSTSIHSAHHHHHHHHHHHTQPKAVQRAEARLGVTTEFKDLNLHSAAANGNLGLVKYALMNGQPANSVLNGLLPLHAAASSGNEAIVRMLIEHGADVNSPRLPRKYTSGSKTSAPAVGTSGLTPLHFAAANGHTAIAALLLSHGANPSATEKYGHTPEALAHSSGHTATAELLRSWREAQDDAAPDSGESATGLGERVRKKLHPKRSLDTLALNLSQTSLGHGLERRGSGSGHELRKGSSLRSLVASAGGTGRRHSPPSLRPSESRTSLASSIWSRAGDQSPRFAEEDRPEDESTPAPPEPSSGTGEGGSTASRRRSDEFYRARSESMSSLGSRRLALPTTAPSTKTSFAPSELSIPPPGSQHHPAVRSHSLRSTRSGAAATFYRPRQSSQLSQSSRTLGSPLATASSSLGNDAAVFVDEDQEGTGDVEGTYKDKGRFPDAVLPRDSSAASSAVSSRPPSTERSSPAGGGGHSDEGSSTAHSRQQQPVLPRIQSTEVKWAVPRDRTDSVDSMSSGFSRPSLFSKPAWSHSTDLMPRSPVDPAAPNKGRVETRSSRSNSAVSDGPFSSSSPASSYSGPGTLSTYAPSNSTVASSVPPSSPLPAQQLARQPLLSPLYETMGGKLPYDATYHPITTSAQARHRIKKAEQELLAYDPSLASSDSTASRPTLSQRLADYGRSLSLEKRLKASEDSASSAGGYRWETISKDGKLHTTPVTIGELKPAVALAVPAEKPKAPIVSAKPAKVADDKPAVATPYWRAIPSQDRLMPPSSPNGRRSVSPNGSSSNPSHSSAALAARRKEKDPDPSASPTRPSSPSSGSGSLGGGLSYVEVVPTQASSSARTTSKRPTASGPKSDKTHSQKGGSVTSGKDQVLIDAAEQARIASSIPTAQITVPKKKGFARRLVSSVRGI